MSKYVKKIESYQNENSFSYQTFNYRRIWNFVTIKRRILNRAKKKERQSAGACRLNVGKFSILQRIDTIAWCNVVMNIIIIITYGFF